MTQHQKAIAKFFRRYNPRTKAQKRALKKRYAMCRIIERIVNRGYTKSLRPLPERSDNEDGLTRAYLNLREKLRDEGKWFTVHPVEKSKMGDQPQPAMDFSAMPVPCDNVDDMIDEAFKTGVGFWKVGSSF